jgi:hypothetical protein
VNSAAKSQRILPLEQTTELRAHFSWLENQSDLDCMASQSTWLDSTEMHQAILWIFEASISRSSWTGCALGQPTICRHSLGSSACF